MENKFLKDRGGEKESSIWRRRTLASLRKTSPSPQSLKNIIRWQRLF
jgi:hypothetical protein